MPKPFVFVSCGQFTEAEKRLGTKISDLVKETTGLDAFFAEDVQDLNGLDTNILEALHHCVGFITVLHPRGQIKRPDGSLLVRASVWIEQEISIATYIQRVEKRSLPVIAFVHRSVGREGIRDLLHLNPIPFADEKEVLATLPARLANWKGLSAGPLGVRLESIGSRLQDGHRIRKLDVILTNGTNESIQNYAAKVCLPSGVLSHWSAAYPEEVRSENPSYRCFRFDEKSRGYIPPHDSRTLIFFEYCTRCAAEKTEDTAALFQAAVDVRVWIDGREYSDRRTIKELAWDPKDSGD